MTLVSGKPNAFTHDLYSSRFRQRPVLNVRISTSGTKMHWADRMICISYRSNTMHRRSRPSWRMCCLITPNPCSRMLQLFCRLCQCLMLR